MGLITSILVGLLAGMAASWLMKKDHKWYVDILIGILGRLCASFSVNSSRTLSTNNSL